MSDCPGFFVGWAEIKYCRKPVISPRLRKG
jgi:hypothetical protein